MYASESLKDNLGRDAARVIDQHPVEMSLVTHIVTQAGQRAKEPFPINPCEGIYHDGIDLHRKCGIHVLFRKIAVCLKRYRKLEVVRECRMSSEQLFIDLLVLQKYVEKPQLFGIGHGEDHLALVEVNDRFLLIT